MVSDDIHLEIGLLAFEGLDQADLTGPFEVLARLPNSTTRIYAKTLDPVRDMKGLRLLPDATLAEAPQLDVLHVPGGYGQEAVMHDQATLEWVRRQATGARYVLSVCTGALICGAAGLLKGRRATTHWSALHLLPLFGGVSVDERVVRRQHGFCRRRHIGHRWGFATSGALAWRRCRPRHSALSTICTRAALRQRHPGSGAGRHSRDRASLGRDDHGTARGDSATCRTASRHRLVSLSARRGVKFSAAMEACHDPMAGNIGAGDDRVCEICANVLQLD